MKNTSKTGLWRRVLAAGLAALMAAAMCIVPVSADGDAQTITVNTHTSDTTADTKTVKFSNLEQNATVTAYRIIDVNFASSTDGQLQTATPTYIWNSAVGKWLSEQTETVTVGTEKVALSAFVDATSYKTSDDSVVYAVTDTFLSLTGDGDVLGTEGDVSTVLQKIMAAIKNTDSSNIDESSVPKSTSEAATTESTLNGETVYTTTLSLPAGVYLAQADGNKAIYNPTSVNVLPMYQDSSWSLMVNASEENSTYQSNDTVNIKGQTPYIEKTSDTENVGIGDTVNFTLEVLVPKYPDSSAQAQVKKLVLIKDTMSDGLTVDSSIATNLKLYVVTNSNNSETETEIADNNYESGAGWEVLKQGDTYDNGEVTETFIVVFNEAFITAHGGDVIRAKYTATVNKDAVTEEINNEAELYYNHDPYSETVTSDAAGEDTVSLYTYGIVVNKYVQENSSSNASLASDGTAAFKLYADNSGSASTTALKFNGYTASSATSATAGQYVLAEDQTSTSATDTLTVDTSGKLELAGLKAGTYYLEEVTAPNGYPLPNGKITITITDSADADGKIDTVTASKSGSIALYTSGSYANGSGITSSETFAYTNSTGTVKLSEALVEVLNNKSTFTLPITGGMGTVIFTLAGLVLMAGAVAFVVVYRKKQAK